MIKEPPPGPLGELTINVAVLVLPPTLRTAGFTFPPPVAMVEERSPMLMVVASRMPLSYVMLAPQVAVSLPETLPIIIVPARMSTGCPANSHRPLGAPEALKPHPFVIIVRPVPELSRTLRLLVCAGLGHVIVVVCPLPLPKLQASALIKVGPAP